MGFNHSFFDDFDRWAKRSGRFPLRQRGIFDVNLQDDLLQETRIRLYRTYGDKYRDEPVPPSLMATVLRSVVFNYIKDSAKHPATVSPEVLDAQQANSSEIREYVALLCETLAELDTQPIAVFGAYIDHSMDAQATADSLGMTKRCVQRNLYRCFELIREMVEDGRLPSPPRF